METKRSEQQNKSMHKLYKMLADELNDSGLDMRVVLKPEVDIPWDEKTVKEYLWKPIQKAMFNKKSTTELNTKEVNKVYDVLARHLGQKFGIDMPDFPSYDNINFLEEFKKI